MTEFAGDLLPDEGYVERVREKTERSLGRLEEVLVTHIRIISSVPEENRPELHKMAYRALLCGYHCDAVTEVLYKAAGVWSGAIPRSSFNGWCFRRFGAIDGSYIATGLASSMIH